VTLYLVSDGATIAAQDINQIVNLLTGTDTATQVTVSNRIRAQLSGATAASGYVGGTTSGPPTSGTFAVGDFVVDQTGCFWICTAAGTPGTWKRAGIGGYDAHVSQTVTAQNLSSGFNIILPDTVDWDPQSMWQAGSHTFKVPIKGTWRLTARGSVQYATSGVRTAVYLTRNGSEFTRGFDALVGYYGGGIVSDDFALNANDTIQLGMYVEASCSTEIIGGRTHMQLELVDV
jgi:hypothetical protein